MALTLGLKDSSQIEKAFDEINRADAKIKIVYSPITLKWMK